MYPQTGWGQVLQPYFDAGAVQVVNRAIGGRSSRSFYQEGRFTSVLAEMQKGDYLLIQFGHNDRDFTKTERYTSTADYKTYLTTYINEARAKGVTPILISPMVMNAYNTAGLRNVFTESGNDYRGSMAAVASEQNVAFADLNLKSFNLVKTVGQNYASRYLYLILQAGEYPNFPDGSSDGTHFQEMGAVEMARLVVEGFEDNKQRADMANLLGRLLPRYNFTTATSVINSGEFTRSARYPAGTPLTLKYLPEGSNKFTQWILSGQVLTNSALSQFVMPKNDVRIDAVVNNVPPRSSSTSSSSSSSTSSSSGAQNFPAAKVFLIGDSTVSFYNSGYAPQEGWGQEIGNFFNSAKITIDNRAIGGRSSKSFYNDHWAAVKADIKPGDFVFIQFGINDRNNADPARYAPTTDGTFQDYMTRFAKETQALGATPVFVSTVPRNAWTGATVYNAYHEHPLVTIELAKTLKIAYLDLNTAATKLMESAGEEYSTYFLYMNIPVGEFSTITTAKADNVHFQAYGAQEMARLLAELIDAQKASMPMTQLAAALKPRLQLTINGNTQAGLVSRSGAYPAGFKLMLRARVKGTSRFVRWQDSAGNTLSTQSIYTYTVPGAAGSITAAFN